MATLKLFCPQLVQQRQWLIGMVFVSVTTVYFAHGLLASSTIEVAQAPNQGTPVLIHNASQEFPDVDGQRIVWQDARFGPTDIFMRELNGAEPRNLTQSTTWEVQPAIDGDLIVWKDGAAGIGIHGIDLSTNTIFTVTTGHRDTGRPHLSAGVVVWADNRAGDQDWNIYAYDIAHTTELSISTAAGNQMDPQIDWPWIVWWDNQERIYLYNVESKQQQTILATRGGRLPDVSAADQVVVWQDMRNGNWDLYGYDLQQQQEIPVIVAPRDQAYAVIDHGQVAYQERTEGSAWNVVMLDLARNITFTIDPQSGDQTQPALSQGLVVWQDIRQHNTDIYAFEWNGEPRGTAVYTVAAPAYLQAGALPGRTILLQWEDHATNEDGFVLERAQGITGTQWLEVAQLPANRTSYLDQPAQRGESYWYRLRARRGGQSSAYSNESFATTFNETPNLYELYLMTLINAARSDPTAFGYADIPPVPPLVYNPLVAYSAHAHSQAILNSGFQFGHCDLIGRCPTERARAVGYGGGCAENLTTTFRTGPAAMQEANQGFLESEGHRNNMLAAALTEFGIGHTFDMNKGDSNRHGQVTEVFCGNPKVTPPALPSGAMVPPIGATTTDFTYLVNFYSATGQAPSKAEVMIDGKAYPLTVAFGTAAHGTYQAVQRLAAGEHLFYFAFILNDGQVARWPTAGVIPYPQVFTPADLPPTAQDPPAPPSTFRHLLYLPYADR